MYVFKHCEFVYINGFFFSIKIKLCNMPYGMKNPEQPFKTDIMDEWAGLGFPCSCGKFKTFLCYDFNLFW